MVCPVVAGDVAVSTGALGMDTFSGPSAPAEGDNPIPETATAARAPQRNRPRGPQAHNGTGPVAPRPTTEMGLGPTGPPRAGVGPPGLQRSQRATRSPQGATGLRRRESRRAPTPGLRAEARCGGYGGRPPGDYTTRGAGRRSATIADRTFSAAARPLSRRRRGHCGASISIRGRGDRVVAAPPHTVTIQGCGYPNKSGS